METQEQILDAMQKVHEEHHMSVVLIINHTVDDLFGVGTGFIIKCTERYALVMTCDHVLENRNSITIRLSGSSDELSATVQYHDKEADLAILLVPMTSKYPELMFREESEDVKVGELVFLAAYYHPDALFGYCLNSDVYPGRICGPLYQTPSNPDLAEVPHSCRTKGGCSGAPLIYSGKTIGVHFQTRTQIEYARPTATVNKMLRKWLNLQDSEVRSTEELIAMFPI